MVRCLLAEVVLHLLRRDGTVRAWYQRIKRRRGSKIARVALMRRTATIIWRMLSTGEAWRPGEAASETPSPASEAAPVRPRRGRRAVLSALVAKETEAGGQSTGSSSPLTGEEVVRCQA